MTIPLRKNYKPTEFKIHSQNELEEGEGRGIFPTSITTPTQSKESLRKKCLEICQNIKNISDEGNSAFLILVQKIIKLKNDAKNRNTTKRLISKKQKKGWSKKKFGDFLKKKRIDLEKCHPLLRFKINYLQEAYEREVENLDTVSKLLLHTENKEFIASCLDFTNPKTGINKNNTITHALTNAISERAQQKMQSLYKALNHKLKEVILYLKQQNYNMNIVAKPELLRDFLYFLEFSFFPTDGDVGCQEHWANPYPSESEKKRLAYLSNMLPKQVSTWFGNYRGRYKVKLEARIKDTAQWLHARDLIPNPVFAPMNSTFLDSFIAARGNPELEAKKESVNFGKKNKNLA